MKRMINMAAIRSFTNYCTFILAVELYTRELNQQHADSLCVEPIQVGTRKQIAASVKYGDQTRLDEEHMGSRSRCYFKSSRIRKEGKPVHVRPIHKTYEFCA